MTEEIKVPEGKDGEGSGTITLTQEELDAKLQAETDKRVTQALKTAKEKWETEFSSKIDSHLKDYEKKAKMTPEQIKQLDLDEKFKLLEQEKSNYHKMKNEMAIATKLQEKKLSTVLTKFVYADDMDVVEQNIATLEQLVLGMVNEEVEKRISSGKPKVGVSTTGLDKEKFKKLSIAERSELYRTNPTLYKELVSN